MAITAYFIKKAKRRNSTLQFSLTDPAVKSYDCDFKVPTSFDRPTLHVVDASYPNYNLAYLHGRYFFVDDVKTVGNNRYEISLLLDSLATVKSELLNQSFFVAYASQATYANYYIVDQRIPETKETFVDDAGGALTYHTYNDIYVLTVNTNDGIEQYVITENDLKTLVQNLSTYLNGLMTRIDNEDISGQPYSFPSTVTSGDALQSLGKMLNQSMFFSNAYTDAPNQIKDCYMTHLKPHTEATATYIFLGQFNTGVMGYRVDQPTVIDSKSISIPWLSTYPWERSAHLSANLVLPYVGVIDLPMDGIAAYDTLYVSAWFTPYDGTIGYAVSARDSNQVLPKYNIGRYVGNAASHIPVGVSQAPSKGAVMQSILSGATQTVTGAIGTIASGLMGNPVGVIGGIAQTAMSGINAAIQTETVKNTYANTTVGTFSGCLDLDNGIIRLCVVKHQLSTSQANFAAKMGYPVQQVVALSALSGYVQCANAHAELSEEAEIIDAVDSYLNSGFFIE